MLKALEIKNIILIDDCRIDLSSGFTVLTGETGAGKTAFLKAIQLLLGQKLDTSLIRSGEKKGCVRAEIIDFPPSLNSFLQELDIEAENSTLFLQREVLIEGKSRCSINGQLVPLTFLQKVSSQLFQIVNQNSHEEIRNTTAQREIVDLFASLEPEVSLFSSLFSSYKEKKKRESFLEEVTRQKEREEDFLLQQEEEIKEFALSKEEEEELFQEYTRCSQSQDVLEKTDQLFTLLSGHRSAQEHLSLTKPLFKFLSPLHSQFLEAESLIETAKSSLDEALYLLRQTLSFFDLHDKRLSFLEEKLHQASVIQKKYGKTPEMRQTYLAQIQEKLSLFSSLEEEKETLQQELSSLEEKLSSLSQTLSFKRSSAAESLTVFLHKELAELNMAQAQVHIQIEKEPRSFFGEDKITFLLAANPGEAMMPAHESSSGGELARLLLACTLCLAEKNRIPTVLFDEIDANVGGLTARKMGEKLHELSTHRQVICITHFSQVATQATLHLHVQKHLSNGRTTTHILSLADENSRSAEILRMLGQKEALSTLH